jgi:hypothetical protein
MDSIIHDSQDLAGLLAIIGGLILIVIVTVVNALKSVAKTRHREQTRREVAAYVAEGSMSADDAEKILKAGTNKLWKCND